LTKKIEVKSGWPKHFDYFGTFDETGFNIISCKRNRFFQVRIKAKIEEGINSSILSVSYKVVDPLFVIVPILLFYSASFFAPTFIFNGVVETKTTKVIFLLGSLLLFSLLITYASYLPFKTEKQRLETELQLKALT
jgi:hypothetical protein